MSNLPDPQLERCKLCKHHEPKDGGWCYMFKDRPMYLCVTPIFQANPAPLVIGPPSAPAKSMEDAYRDDLHDLLYHIDREFFDEPHDTASMITWAKTTIDTLRADRDAAVKVMVAGAVALDGAAVKHLSLENADLKLQVRALKGELDREYRRQARLREKPPVVDSRPSNFTIPTQENFT